MKRQMEILQSAQDVPSDDRLVAGESGYTDVPAEDRKDAPPTTGTEQPPPVTSPAFSEEESPGADKPLLPHGVSSPYTDFSSDGSVVSPPTGAGDTERELMVIAEGVEEGAGQEASGPFPYLVSY